LRKIQLIIAAAVLFVVGCKEKTKPTDKFNPNMPVSVDITIAEVQKVDKQIEVNGTVLANDFVELHPETNGRITFLQSPDGKMVKAGTVFAKLNDADLQAQLAKLKVQLELANIKEQRNKQ
jgi:membrane fusion protein (multidrug efflux system)